MEVMGRKEPLPTITFEGAAEEDGKIEDKLPGSEVMCAEAPVSMNHPNEGGGVSVMVLNACMSWFWSHDEGGVDGAIGEAVVRHCAPCHDGVDGAWDWCGREAT